MVSHKFKFIPTQGNSTWRGDDGFDLGEPVVTDIVTVLPLTAFSTLGEVLVVITMLAF